MQQKFRPGTVQFDELWPLAGRWIVINEQDQMLALLSSDKTHHNLQPLWETMRRLKEEQYATGSHLHMP